jgi:Family of unknown function (DUF6941)
MHLELAVICDEAHERPDGKFDVVGVFNELTAPGFPAMQSSMTVVFVMEWGPEEAGGQEFRADLVDTTGRRVLSIEGRTEVAEPTGEMPARTRLIMPLEDVVFPQAGRYHFEIIAAGDVHRGCSVLVSLQKDPSVRGASP